MAKTSLSGVVITPAFNEALVVDDVVSRIDALIDLDIWVINDCSDDETASVARAAGAMVIDLPIRMGAWTATQTGLRAARRLGYDFAITMDADGQHDLQMLSL